MTDWSIVKAQAIKVMEDAEARKRQADRAMAELKTMALKTKEQKEWVDAKIISLKKEKEALTEWAKRLKYAELRVRKAQRDSQVDANIKDLLRYDV